MKRIPMKCCRLIVTIAKHECNYWWLFLMIDHDGVMIMIVFDDDDYVFKMKFVFDDYDYVFKMIFS